MYNLVLVKICLFVYSYERFYNASSDPLAFYQIVFSKQDVVSCRQNVGIDSDCLWEGWVMCIDNSLYTLLTPARRLRDELKERLRNCVGG